MAITAISKFADSSEFTDLETYDTGSVSYTTGRRIVVIAQAERDGHTSGLDTDWALPSDDASTNSITWTELAASALDDAQGSNFRCQTVVWYSSELTATESFTITVDADSGSTNTFFYNMQVVELANWDGTTEQAVQIDEAPAETDNESITFASAPSEFQLIASMIKCGTAITAWDSPASGFTVLSGSEESDPGGCRVLTSTTNTTATVADGVSTGGAEFFNYHLVGMELTEEGGTVAEIYNGTSWVAADVEVYNGTAWVAADILVES